MVILIVTVCHCLPANAKDDTSNPEKARQRLTMVYTRPEPNLMVCFTKKLFTEAFSRLGITLETHFAPAARASSLVSTGQVDGDLSRIHKYDQLVDNVVRVEFPNRTTRFAAYANSPITLKSWQDIRESDKRIVFMRGVAVAHKALDGLPPERLHVVPAANDGFKLLNARRADIFIGLDWLGDKIIREQYADSGIHKAGVIETITLHAFLHKKHEHLAPKLADSLRALKNDGTLAAFAAECGLEQ
ncbi:hypothetical protein JCM12178A_00600 [Salidesulfovibrio brasiliensis]